MEKCGSKSIADVGGEEGVIGATMLRHGPACAANRSVVRETRQLPLVATTDVLFPRMLHRAAPSTNLTELTFVQSAI